MLRERLMWIAWPAFLVAAVLILAGFNSPGAVLLCAALAGFGLQLSRALRIART